MADRSETDGLSERQVVETDATEDLPFEVDEDEDVEQEDYLDDLDDEDDDYEDTDD